MASHVIREMEAGSPDISHVRDFLNKMGVKHLEVPTKKGRMFIIPLGETPKLMWHDQRPHALGRNGRPLVFSFDEGNMIDHLNGGADEAL